MATDPRIIRFAEIEVAPGKVAAYRALLAEEIRASVAREPGVIMLNAVMPKDAPNSVRILEVYADRSAYEAHLGTPHFLKYKTETADMVVSLRLVDLDPIELASKALGLV
jgi:quinol monooxygenase YgiN